MKGYKHTTAAQKQSVIDLFHQGFSTPYISETLGISGDQVRKVLRSSGLKARHRRDGVCFRNETLIRQFAADGLSLSEMARRLKTNKRYVLAFLKLRCIPYQRFRQSGKNNPSWKGGRMIEKGKKNKKSYVLLFLPEHPFANRHGYVREHRLVMESVLGRLLLPTEVVHHKDGDSLNNSPENLEVYSSNSEHLADELAGKVPNWTEEGKKKILESVRRPRSRKQKPSQTQ